MSLGAGFVCTRSVVRRVRGSRARSGRRQGSGRYPGRVTFRPEAIPGVRPGAAATVPGQIDYRLARRNLIAEFKRGRLAQHEVCDAHPELVRAALHAGSEIDELCPICEDDNLVIVTYVFGPRLPAFGRCVTSKAELAKLARRREELAAYVVEVCRSCRWNHLARSFLIGGTRRR